MSKEFKVGETHGYPSDYFDDKYILIEITKISKKRKKIHYKYLSGEDSKVISVSTVLELDANFNEFFLDYADRMWRGPSLGTIVKAEIEKEV